MTGHAAMEQLRAEPPAGPAQRKGRSARGLPAFLRGAASFLKSLLLPAPVASGRLALFLLAVVIAETGLEAAYVQAETTRAVISPALLSNPSFLFLFCLDLLVPLTVALLSRRLFIVYLALDCLQNIILLHYNIFFYNTLTLATIYHSMQGASSLGLDIFGFARWDIIAACLALFAGKAVLTQLSLVPHSSMPWVWKLRGITAVACMTVIWCVAALIYGQTGLSALWVDKRGHRTATERRLQQGAREAVRNIGYLATWIGEWRSGTYSDTALIYAEMRCQDPDAQADATGLQKAASGPQNCMSGTINDATSLQNNESETINDATDSQNCASGTRKDATATWQGLPLPRGRDLVALIQIESLDFAALSMKVNGHTVLPFIDYLAQESLTLKAFAPHKVGSSNADYEILNRRVADQNVMYYSYIKNYPDSAIKILAERGYAPAVFHGLDGKLFSLRQAYAAQGFEHFFFKEELLAAGYAPSRLIMEHVLDEDLFDMAATQLRLDKGPKAQFIVTMSSHIPFTEPLPIFKKTGGTFARYVSSLRYLDQCLAAYYAQLPDGALLILWGDHGSDVTYPPGFPENSRHVPFMVHVKGDRNWMEKLPANPSGDALRGGAPFTPPLRREESPRLASQKIYSLCELGHFLHRIVERARPQSD